ncbi:hypothetical protein OLMES_0253 [Oleiphilus messinensis]|uniref:Pentapeptide repeat-containing protein n=1 Tax=Oleiphilus messinensis TaxID=141451 RepID=A0A1Y0I2B8_9GAMM|nr:pentapeptide repeat-containing protein [Oleiphilus messinensis]ARU54359.1 hypothetical protein OLMES_0253 [Oleiphilus messinensis]
MGRTLRGQEAFNLFQQGKEAWNCFIDEQDVTKVDFRGVTFSRALELKVLSISFRGFVFPEVRFETLNFDSLSTIDFSEAIFRGNAYFSGVMFPVGKLLFSGACFKQAAVFSLSSFQGGADFSEAEIEIGVFDKTKWLREGDVSFNGARVGGLNFTDSEGIARIEFYFGFRSCNSGIDFSNSTFHEIQIQVPTPVLIDHLRFDCVKVHQECVLNNLTALHISMRNCDFNGNFMLGDLVVKRLDCAGSKFERNADFHNIAVKTYIDFNGCSFSHPVAIDGIRLGDPIGWGEFGTQSALSQSLSSIKKRFFMEETEPHNEIELAEIAEYARSYRRLKQLAAESDNHSLELDMFALELKASRWLKAEWWARIPYDLYALFSDYGRSLLRPVVGLFIFWILFSLVYMGCAASSSRSDFMGQWSAGLLLSLAQSVPFLTWHRTAKSEALAVLYPAAGGFDVPWIVHLAAVSQSILAVIFIFLLGLGIRNRFRI